MGETKKIVTEHYPAEKLPEELRKGLEEGQLVRVTVEPEGTRAITFDLLSFLGAGAGVYSTDEAVSYIRTLRDE
jgi:uncharacterized protein (DUF1786 family)